MPVHPGRGEGLEARHHHQADPAGDPGPAQWPQHQGPRPGRGLHLLLSEQGRLREEGEGPGQGHGCRVEQWIIGVRGWPTLRIMELLQIYRHPLIKLCIFVFEPNVYIYFISWYKTTVFSKFVTSITVSINDVYDTLCYLIIHDCVSKFRSAALRNLLQQTLELSFGLDHWPMPPVLCWCCKM